VICGEKIITGNAQRRRNIIQIVQIKDDITNVINIAEFCVRIVDN
jgi:hypothetical protein